MRIYCVTVPCYTAISDLVSTPPVRSAVDAANRLNPPRPQRPSNESFVELQSALEGSGQNRKVVFAMCAYARAIGRTLVEPCVRAWRIDPCDATGATPLSTWYDVRELRKVCNIVNASIAAAALARIPFGVTRRHVHVGYFGRWRPDAPGTSLEDPAAALLSFDMVARSEVFDGDRLGLWTVIRRHHPMGSELWRFRSTVCKADPNCLDSYFPVVSGVSAALLTAFSSMHNLSDGAYDVYQWRSEQGPGIVFASSHARGLQRYDACARTLATAIRERATVSGRPIVLVSDIPFGKVTLSPSYAGKTPFLGRVRALLQPLVLKVDTTPGNWSGGVLWHADMHLFKHAAEAFQCTRPNSSVCRVCAQSAESSSSTWLAGQRSHAGRKSHVSWLDGLDEARAKQLEADMSELEGSQD